MDPATAVQPAVSLDDLVRQVSELRQRVAALERHAVVDPVPVTPAPAEVNESTNLSDSLPTVGKTLLGIAGAYLLRAMTEMGVLSPVPGVALGFLYAAAWLYAAARIPADRRFAAGLAALTSAGILGPLLWESLARFQAVSPATAAGVIAAF